MTFFSCLFFAGCHQVSFATTALEVDPDPDVYCLPRDTESAVLFDNSILARWTFGDDRTTFSVCSDSVSYVRCSVQFWVPGPTSVIFSTVSIPFRTPLTPTVNTPSVGRVSQEGLTAMSSVLFGESGLSCADFYSDCFDWIVPPISDPLIFWPPPSQLPKFDTLGTNVFRNYFEATNAQPLEKTLIGVFALTAGSTEVYSRSRLDKVSIALTFVTNELGETPALLNNAPDLHPKTQSSPSGYLSTISFDSFPVVDLAGLCDETSYEALQTIVNEELAEILDSESLDSTEFHKV